MHTVIDHLSDVDFKVFYKIVKTASAELIEIFEEAEVDYTKHASASSDVFAIPDQRLFPVDSLNNTILSKAYFEHFRNDMPTKVAEEADIKISKYLALHSIPEHIFESKITKVAEEAPDPIELLPSLGLCKIANITDLNAAATLFEQDRLNLTVAQRVEFARNFVKAASALKVESYPNLIAKYASKLNTDLNRVKVSLDNRAAMTVRSGGDPEKYMKLAAFFDSPEFVETDEESLSKLAEVIHNLDLEVGFDHPKYDRHIASAYDTVFTEPLMDKTAEEMDVDTELENYKQMSKADIVGKFGAGVMDEVESDEGDINYKKLKEISTLQGPRL